MYFIWLILNPALLPVEIIHISYLNTLKNEFSKKQTNNKTPKSQNSLNQMFQLWRGRVDEEQLCECFPPHPLLKRVWVNSVRATTTKKENKWSWDSDSTCPPNNSLLNIIPDVKKTHNIIAADAVLWKQNFGLKETRVFTQKNVTASENTWSRFSHFLCYMTCCTLVHHLHFVHRLDMWKTKISDSTHPLIIPY